MLVDAFVRSNYEMRTVLRVLFHAEFFKQARFARVKSAAELVAGTVRLAGGHRSPEVEDIQLALQTGYMGQQLLDPLATEGDLRNSWGQGGSGVGEFNLPWGIAIDHHGHMYVADWRNDRIQRFDSHGRYLASYGGSGRGDGAFSRPTGVSVDQEGAITDDPRA